MNTLSHLDAIFTAALTRVDPFRMLTSHVSVTGDRLVASFDGQRHEVDLGDFDRIFVIGMGKAAARMAKAMETILGDRISDGVVVTKYGHGEKLEKLPVIEAGHPIPDQNSVEGARRITELARKADSRTLAITLISGGGSALVCAPYEGLSLDDKQAATGALLACGAEIAEINCLRKHLSMLKGGRLLGILAPARSLNFILSDVVGDSLDTIASGVTQPDGTSYAQALGVLDKYGVRGEIPAAALSLLERGAAGEVPETPKPGANEAKLAQNVLIGTNLAACLAAREKGRALGYNVSLLTSSLTGEAREVAKVLWSIALDVRKRDLLVPRPALVIAGGETTVTLKGKGRGGRNQEMALAFLSFLAADDMGGEGVSFLSASTDGTDGPTDAAGAFASTEIWRRAQKAGLSIADFLADNDAYSFFDGVDGLLRTGPTMTNVCDLHLAIIE